MHKFFLPISSNCLNESLLIMEAIHNPEQSVADRLVYGPKGVFEQLASSGIWTASEHITGTESDKNNIDQILARMRESTTLKHMLGENVIIVPTRRKIIEIHGATQWGSQVTFNPTATPTLIASQVVVTQVNALKTTAGTLGDLPFAAIDIQTTVKFHDADAAKANNVHFIFMCYYEKDDMICEKSSDTRVYNTVRWTTHAGLCAISLAEQNYNGTHTMTSYGPMNFLSHAGRMSEGNARLMEIEGSGMETATTHSVSFESGNNYPLGTSVPDKFTVGKDAFTAGTAKVEGLSQLNGLPSLRVRHEVKTLKTGTDSLKFEHPAYDIITPLPDPFAHSEKRAEASGSYGESQKKVTIKLNSAENMYKVGFSNFNIVVACSIQSELSLVDKKATGPGVVCAVRIPYIASDSRATGGETNNIKMSLGYHELGREYDRLIVHGNQTFTTFLFRTYNVSKTTSDNKITYNTSSLSLPTGGIMYGIRQIQSGKATFMSMSTGINFGVYNIHPYFEQTSVLIPKQITDETSGDAVLSDLMNGGLASFIPHDDATSLQQHMLYLAPKFPYGFSSMKTLRGYTMTCKEAIKSINFGLSSTTIINESSPQVHNMMNMAKPILGNSIFGRYLHRLELCHGGTDMDTIPGGYNLSRVNNVTMNVTTNENINSVSAVEFALMFISTILMEIAPGVKGQKVA